MLWGNYAKNKSKLIDHNKHLVLLSGHPSPLSAIEDIGLATVTSAKQINILKKKI